MEKLRSRLSNSPPLSQLEGNFSRLRVSESTPNISDSRVLGIGIRRLVKIVHLAILNPGEF